MDKGNVKLLLKDIVKTNDDLTDVLHQWHTEMIPRVDRTFDLAGGQGSAEKGGYDPFRDIRWEPFAAQGQRKDGSVIPAWGGVARKDGNGVVKGRLRASGKRITRDSRLNQDSGRFRSRAITGFVKIDSDSIVYGPNLNYAENLEELRPVISLTDSDADLLQEILVSKLFKTPRPKK